MSTSSKTLDLSCLVAMGYKFGSPIETNKWLKTSFRDKNLACKILPKRKNDDKARLEVLKQLSHPHVIHIDSIIKNEKFLCIFTPWIDSENLLSFIRRNGTVEEVKANLWFYQIICAVKYLHAMDYAHCNLSCISVMVSGGNIVISNLEFMKQCANDVKILPKTNKSTPLYNLAPEQSRRSPCNLKKVDVFSLGTILFMMLNAMIPFTSEDPVQVVDDQMNRRYQMRTSNINRLSLNCQVMIHTLLEPDPEIRWNIEKIYGMKWLSKFIDMQGDY